MQISPIKSPKGTNLEKRRVNQKNLLKKFILKIMISS